LEFLSNNDINLEEWNELLEISNYSSVFQSPKFYQLYNSVQGFKAEVFALRESSSLLALCVVTLQNEKGVRGYFSRRAIVYGGPILIENRVEVLNLLIEFVNNGIKRKAIYIEIRNYFDYSQYQTIYTNANWKLIPYLNFQLSLENSLDSVLGKMSYNRRREIKLSLAEGTIYREAYCRNDVEELYNILKDLYRYKVKLPLPSLDYFLLLFYSSIGKVFIVVHNSRIIGGAFCFVLQRNAIYTAYYCGLRDYHKKIFPTHLSILAAIDFGVRNNLEYLDFMGAGLKNKEYGVRKYKKEFGGNLIEHGRFVKINNILLYNLGKIGLKMLRILM
jgi:serine/alanine adding enzyme